MPSKDCLYLRIWDLSKYLIALTNISQSGGVTSDTVAIDRVYSAFIERTHYTMNAAPNVQLVTKAPPEK